MSDSAEKDRAATCSATCRRILASLDTAHHIFDCPAHPGRNRKPEAETVPVVRGWRTYADGSHSEVERWVRHADGDWISLDTNRRTSGDIFMEVD